VAQALVRLEEAGWGRDLLLALGMVADELRMMKHSLPRERIVAAPEELRASGCIALRTAGQAYHIGRIDPQCLGRFTGDETS
jgi:hypothetical protein